MNIDKQIESAQRRFKEAASNAARVPIRKELQKLYKMKSLKK